MARLVIHIEPFPTRVSTCSLTCQTTNQNICRRFPHMFEVDMWSPWNCHVTRVGKEWTVRQSLWFRLVGYGKESPVEERDLVHSRQNENARVCRGRAQGNTFTVVGLWGFLYPPSLRPALVTLPLSSSLTDIYVLNPKPWLNRSSFLGLLRHLQSQK